MKNYKIILLTNCLIAFTAFTAISQNNPTTLDKLQASTWEHKTSVSNTMTAVYDSEQIIKTLNGERYMTFEYYLSDRIDTVFDETKIGQVPNGKYLVRRSKTSIDDGIEREITVPNRFTVYEIKQLNKNGLSFRYSKHQHTVKYKAVE
jgi:hypothetical protein